MSASKFFRNFLTFPQMGTKGNGHHPPREKENRNDCPKIQKTKGSALPASKSKSKSEIRDLLSVSHDSHQHQEKISQSRSTSGLNENLNEEHGMQGQHRNRRIVDLITTKNTKEERGGVELCTTADRWKEVENDSNTAEYKHSKPANTEIGATDVGRVEYASVKAMDSGSLKECKTEDQLLEEVVAPAGVFDGVFQNYSNSPNDQESAERDSLEATTVSGGLQEHADVVYVVLPEATGEPHQDSCLRENAKQEITHNVTAEHRLSENTALHRSDSVDSSQVVSLVVGRGCDIQETDDHFLAKPSLPMTPNSFARTETGCELSCPMSENVNAFEKFLDNLSNNIVSGSCLPIVTDSRISNATKTTSNQSQVAGDSSKFVNEKGISPAACVVYKDAFSSLTSTQPLLLSDHQEEAKEISFTSSHHAVNNSGTSSVNAHAMVLSKLPPTAVLVDIQGIFQVQDRVRPFACGYCGRPYKEKMSVSIHIRTEHCEKRCIWYVDLDGRIRVTSQESNVKRNLFCKFCGQRYAHENDLLQHVMIHTQTRPFACEQCGRRFRTHGYLRTHKAHATKCHWQGSLPNNEIPTIVHPVEPTSVQATADERLRDGNTEEQVVAPNDIFDEMFRNYVNKLNMTSKADDPEAIAMDRCGIKPSRESRAQRLQDASIKIRCEEAVTISDDDDECKSIASSSNTESYEEAVCQDTEMEEEEEETEEAIIKRYFINFAASSDVRFQSPSQMKSNKTQEQTYQEPVFAMNNCTAPVDQLSGSSGQVNANNLPPQLVDSLTQEVPSIPAKSDRSAASGSGLQLRSRSKRELQRSSADLSNPVLSVNTVAIVGESRILGTTKARCNRNSSKGYSSNVGREKRIKEKRISFAADIAHQVEVSSPKSSQGSTITQALLSSDLSKTAKEVPGSFFRRANNNRGSFRTFSSHMATSKLPPGSVLVSDRGVFRLTAKEKPFACGYCGKTFKVKHAVYGHIVQQHEEKRYSCEFCGKRFAEACLLATHVTMHTQEKPITCDQCGMRFRLASALRFHKYTHSEKRLFHCNQCSKSFKFKNCLSRHNNESHQTVEQRKGVACDICRRKFSKPYLLKDHMLIHTGEKPFKCTLCEKQFRTKFVLQGHVNSHNGKKRLAKDPCSVCGKTLWATRMADHMRMHAGEKPYECNICGERFPKKQNLEGHMRSHTGEKPFACDRCDKRFALYSNMVTHKAKCTTVTENVG